MESGTDGASSQGALISVLEASDEFRNSVLSPLRSSYLYEESKQCFRYKSACLIKNPALEEKYNTFRVNKGQTGYSEEELEETFGFLLFDNVDKALELGKTGVLTGNSTCTTLGDPSKGVYTSMYSDCLDLNRWYHGKSGCIAIVRLTKGRVKKISENYTQNFTAPTAGFDCHVSEELPSVSSKTSSFLAFERTQYYSYELQEDGSNEAARSPSLVCPFAIVSFSYTDSKETILAPQEKSEEKRQAPCYLPWKGQLQIGITCYSVVLKTPVGALIPTKLPPVVKVERGISMSDLRQLVPKTIFESSFSREVCLEGLYYNLCKLVSSVEGKTSSLSELLREIKENDVALTVLLKDGGFLVLLHGCHFFQYDDSGTSSEVLQGIFVFPESQCIGKDTKIRESEPSSFSSEVLQILPLLSYAEGEVEKMQTDVNEELCDVMAQHMESYAALINPGLTLSPVREIGMFPDHYEVSDAHKHLYSSPEWTEKEWKSLQSYVSKPVSFQLPVSKASEILAVGQQEEREDLDDDVYICLSSPEAEPDDTFSVGTIDQLADQKSDHVDTSVDSCFTRTVAQLDLADAPQKLSNYAHVDDTNKEAHKSDLTVLVKTDDMGVENSLAPPPAHDLPAELIVSITSAQTVTNESLSAISMATKENDLELPTFSAAKSQTPDVNSLNEETVKNKTVLDCPQIRNLGKRRWRKKRRGHFRGRKKAPKAPVSTLSSQPKEDVNVQVEEDVKAPDSPGQLHLNKCSDIGWKKQPQHKGKFGKQSKDMTDDTTKVAPEVAAESNTDSGKRTLGSTILTQLEACRLRKKTERWDLKPVISQCGRILVPHGSSDIADQIKHLKEKLVSTKDEQLPQKMQVDAPPKDQDTVEMEEMPSTAPESVDEVEEIKVKDDGNHLQTVVSHVNPESAPSTQSDEGKGSVKMNPDPCEHSSKNGTTDTSSSEAVKEKHIPTISLDCTSKNEFSWYKLKHFISSGKRKNDLISDFGTDFPQDMESYSKKSKGSSGPEMLKTSDTITNILDSNVGVIEVPKAPSVDPLFALALGLTPKGIQNVQRKENSTGAQELIILDKKPEIIQSLPSMNPKKTRVKALKTLKKHQGLSEEHVKEKWWLHFQTPACISSENRKCSRDYSVSKTVKEKMHTACPSTDALNLLADLALFANNDQGQPQLDPERKPESSSDKCDLTKDMSTEQESVLHTLLRLPVARPLQLPEAASQSCPVEGNELIDLVSEEHAYSLHPCSSLLLGLPGAPFQVSPLSGSTRVLHHHHTINGNGIQTVLPSVGPEVRGEHKHKTQEHLKKHLQFRRKFRHLRRFVESDGSIKVTRRWKENYDFSRDSKFSTDSKDRTIIRALHGPWDVSIKDTPEEVQLIVHMWIGLFYSRSTARFFDYDSSLFCSEESNSMEKSTHTQSDLDARAPLSVPDMINLTLAKALDLSKNDVPSMEQETKALDLSLRDSNADVASADSQVNKKETSVCDEQKDAKVSSSSPELPPVKEAQTSQDCRKATLPAKIIGAMDVFRNVYRNKRTYLQKAGQLEDTSGTCKVYGTQIPVQEMRGNVPDAPKTQTVTALEHVLHGSNNEKSDMKDGIENSGVKMNLEKHGAESSKSPTDNEVNSDKEEGGVVSTDDSGKSGFRHVKNGTMEEWSSEEKPIALSWNGLHSGDVSRKTESDTVSRGNHLEDSSWKKAGDISDPVSCDLVNVRKSEDCSLAYDEKGSIAPFEKNGNGPKERDIHCIPAVSDMSGKPSPAICDSSDSSTKECNHPTPLDEQSLKTETANGACGVQPRIPCPNGTSLTKEQNGSEKAPHPSMDGDHNQNEPSVMTNSGDGFGGNGVSCKKSADFIAAEEKTGSTTQKEPSPHNAQVPQSDVAGKVEPELPLTEEKVHSSGGTNELEKAYCGFVIPFIGRDLSGENILEPVQSPKKEDVKEGKDPSQRDKQFISDITNHKVISSIKGQSLFQMFRKEAELPPCQTHLLDVSQTSQQIDDRSPTPTIDEKTMNSVPCSGSSALSGSETCQNVEKCPSRSLTPVTVEMANEQKPCTTSALNSHPERHHDLHRRTLRVLQSLDRFFSKSDEIDTNDLKRSLDETSNLSNNIPSKPVMVLAPKEHREHTESSGYFQKAPFTNKLEEVLGVKLQFKKTDSLVHCFERPDTLQDISDGQDLHPLKSALLSECSEAKMDQVRHKTPSQANLSEFRSNSLRPVMAVKPSKSDDGFMEEGHTEKSAKLTSPNNVNTVVTNTTPTSMMSEKEIDCLKGNSEPLGDHLEGVKELCSRGSWSCKENPSVSSADGVVFSCQAPPSAYSAQCSDSSTISPDFGDEKQNGPSVEKVEQTPKKDKKTEPEGCSDALDSTLDHRDDMTDESRLLGPDHSMMCTIYNTSQKLSLSFLEQISKRCLQENLTQASMEQECLIFLEKMKQLLKRKKGKPSSEEDIHDQLPCLSPLTVSFSSLGEQEDSLVDMDATTLGRKIKVDMSDRDIATENKKTHYQRSAPGGGKPAEHDGVSNAAAKCATLYMAMMTDVCAGKKTQCSHSSIRDEIYPKTESSSHFDFCDSMKRKLDESYRSDLNSVLKKSCKRKYRFYILVTSDDPFFEETRALLEAEGHTSVESPDLLLSEDNSSSQLIILRNEDIAEHICEVPHLLELKKSPGVQFVGIDEPDDVVNLTYQELFFRGGFIMLDTAALESLSLSNLNKMSEILKELNRNGKWKWMLHYRDSRRLKENARLSAEAKEKNIFLNCLKDGGLLEVMPYHECDRMSRDQPEYLTCLTRLQIQNISARYPVFVTDTNADDEFEKNGVLTIDIKTLLTGQFAV